MTRPLNIAFVDDEKDFFTLCKIIFRKEIAENIFRFYFFLNGKECSDFLSEKTNTPIDIILTDLNMPIMNGFELLKFSQKLHPKLPVFVISAYGSEEYKQEAKAMGASEYFVKPIDFNAVKAKIEEYSS